VVESLDADHFLREHVAAELRTVFPSTTASAFTSLATGEWPSRHGALGWYTYIPAASVVATIVPFVRSIDEVPLSELGVPVEQAFPIPSSAAGVTRDSLSLVPAPFAEGVFTQYCAGGTPVRGYNDLAEAAEAVVGRVRATPSPTYTYLYVPSVDYAGHELGYSDPRTIAAADALGQVLEGLTNGLAGRGRIVVTADHGGLDAGLDEIHMLQASDPLVRLLKHEPSGDSRVVYFDVLDGAEAELERLFRDRFADRFFLLTVDEAEEIVLFGPGPLSGEARRRLGTFVAIAKGADVLLYAWPSRDPTMQPFVGHHSGLSPAEVRIPLIVV
jgi:predicted AlkP superfamily pyrophosphatase or phosphodiesterase